MRKRCGIADEELLAATMPGAVRSGVVPAHWRRFILDRVAAITAEEQAALETPEGKGLQYKAKAQQFLLEVALVDYVIVKNQRGLGVSSRAVIERKGFCWTLWLLSRTEV